MISVIIPIYNAEKELPRMLDCLLEQTERDFEVLLVDDGSKDGTGHICDEIAEKDSRFHAIHQANAGVSAARNRGLAEAKGEYITFLDADDKIPNNYLEELFDTCESEDADIAVCDVVTKKDNVEKLRFTLPNRILTQSEALDFLLTRRSINSGPCAKLFKRKVIKDIKFPALKAYEDILFVKDAFCNSKIIVSTNKTEYYYIENTDGAMSNFLKVPSLDIVKATDELLAFYKTRRDLSSMGLYITISHLMQYIIPMLPNLAEHEMPFINAARKLYRKYAFDICRCKAFLWKEKIVYLAFSIGWIFSKKKFSRIRVK